MMRDDRKDAHLAAHIYTRITPIKHGIYAVFADLFRFLQRDNLAGDGLPRQCHWSHKERKNGQLLRLTVPSERNIQT